MTDKLNYNGGDRIKITVEGVVRNGTWPNEENDDWGVTLVTDEGHVTLLDNSFMRDHDVTVEVIDSFPFGPGDVIRHKTKGKTYVIGEGGVITCLPSGAVLSNIPEWYKKYATATSYEKVTI